MLRIVVVLATTDPEVSAKCVPSPNPFPTPKSLVLFTVGGENVTITSLELCQRAFLVFLAQGDAEC
jgi:hypothetical protein